MNEVIISSGSLNRHDTSTFEEMLAGIKKAHYEVVRGVSSAWADQYVREVRKL
jgi:hypothetical protein